MTLARRCVRLAADITQEGRCCCVFFYVGLVELTPEGREKLASAPLYFDKIRAIIEEEGGELDRAFTVMGPWDFLAIVKYPSNEAAFRALGKIGKLEVVTTETFPIEDVEVFLKTLV